MSSSQNFFNEKMGFIVALFAAIIALYPFKNYSDKIVINLGFSEPSLTVIFGVFLSLLSLSIYFYALNYTRLDHDFLLKISSLKYLENFARWLYFIAILIYPTGIFILYIFNAISAEMVAFTIPNTTALKLHRIAWLVSAIVFMMLLLNLRLSLSQRGNMLLLDFSDLKTRSLEEAKKSYKRGVYDYMVIQLYNGLLNLIKEKLLEKYGNIVDKIHPRKLFILAVDEGLLTTGEFSILEDLRGLRNQVAHAVLPMTIDADLAKKFLEGSEKIIKKIYV